MVTILLCLLAMFVIGYFYLFDNFIASSFYRSLTDSSIPEKYDQFNCELPPNYWYYRGEEDEKILWKGITKNKNRNNKVFKSQHVLSNRFKFTERFLPCFLVFMVFLLSAICSNPSTIFSCGEKSSCFSSFYRLTLILMSKIIS